MSRRYTAEDEEAIYSMLCAGHNLKQIQRLAAAGNWPRPRARDIPYSSLKAIRDRVVARHGPPTPIVRAEDEKDAVSTARRRLVKILENQAEKLIVRGSKARVLERDEQRQAIELEKALADIERRAEGPAPDKSNTNQGKGHKTRKANDARTLAAIAERAAAEAQEPASSPLTEAQAEGSSEGASPALANGSSPAHIPASAPA